MPQIVPQAQERPMGVTILAILYFISGLMWIAGGYLITSWFSWIFEFAGMGEMGLLCLIPFVLVALIYFLVGWGLLALKGWARGFAFILAIIGLLNIPIGTIISIIIIIYLSKPEVKAAFKKN
jgi:hypothetical protein